MILQLGLVLLLLLRILLEPDLAKLPPLALAALVLLEAQLLRVDALLAQLGQQVLVQLRLDDAVDAGGGLLDELAVGDEGEGVVERRGGGVGEAVLDGLGAGEAAALEGQGAEGLGRQAVAEDGGHGRLERRAEEHLVEAQEALGRGGQAVVVRLGEHQAAGKGVAVEEGDGGHGIPRASGGCASVRAGGFFFLFFSFSFSSSFFVFPPSPPSSFAAATSDISNTHKRYAREKEEKREKRGKREKGKKKINSRQKPHPYVVKQLPEPFRVDGELQIQPVGVKLGYPARRHHHAGLVAAKLDNVERLQERAAKGHGEAVVRRRDPREQVDGRPGLGAGDGAAGVLRTARRYRHREERRGHAGGGTAAAGGGGGGGGVVGKKTNEGKGEREREVCEEE